MKAIKDYLEGMVMSISANCCLYKPNYSLITMEFY